MGPALETPPPWASVRSPGKWGDCPVPHLSGLLCQCRHRAGAGFSMGPGPQKMATFQVGSFLGIHVTEEFSDLEGPPMSPKIPLVLLLKGLLPAASHHSPFSCSCLLCPLRSASGKDHAAYLLSSDIDRMGVHQASTWTPALQGSVQMACQKL